VFSSLQGWIVCEEHRDVLVAAWEEDQAIQQQKEAEVIHSSIHLSINPFIHIEPLQDNLLRGHQPCYIYLIQALTTNV